MLSGTARSKSVENDHRAADNTNVGNYDDADFSENPHAGHRGYVGGDGSQTGASSHDAAPAANTDGRGGVGQDRGPPSSRREASRVRESRCGVGLWL